MTDISSGFNSIYRSQGIFETIKAIDAQQRSGTISKNEAKRAIDLYLTDWGGQEIFKILSKGSFLMLRDTVYKRVQEYLLKYGRNATKEGMIRDLTGKFGLTGDKQQAIKELKLKFN